MFRLAGHLSRLLLAGVFLLAGSLKALDPEGFTREVVQYGILTGATARVFAYSLIPVELAAAVALLINFRPVVSFSLAAALLVMFVGAVGWAIATDQPLTECGCFGRNTPRTPAQTLGEDVGFLAAAVLGLVALRGTAGGGPAPRARWKVAALAVTVLASGAFVIAAPGLPIDDLATALRPGVRWESLNVALAEADLSKGAHVVVLMGMRDPATAQALGALNGMAAAARFDMIGLYADDETAYNEFFWTAGPSFPLYHAAPSDLGRLHRRLPRLFAVKDGVVKATWSDLPTEDQVALALD